MGTGGWESSCEVMVRWDRGVCRKLRWWKGKMARGARVGVMGKYN